MVKTARRSQGRAVLLFPIYLSSTATSGYKSLLQSDEADIVVFWADAGGEAAGSVQKYNLQRRVRGGGAAGSPHLHLAPLVELLETGIIETKTQD